MASCITCSAASHQAKEVPHMFPQMQQRASLAVNCLPVWSLSHAIQVVRFCPSMGHRMKMEHWTMHSGMKGTQNQK